MAPMTTDFLTLRSKSTGKTGEYPSHFAAFDDFEIINSDDAPCIDCVIPTPLVEDPDEEFLALDDDEDIDDYDEEGEDRGL